MSKDHFVLTAVHCLPDYSLRLTYADGQTFDGYQRGLTPLILAFQHLAAAISFAAVLPSSYPDWCRSQ